MSEVKKEEESPSPRVFTPINPPGEEQPPTERHVMAEESTPSKKPTPLFWGGLLVVLALIVTGLFLPPISLGQRLGLTGNGAEETAAQPVIDTATEEAPSLPGGIQLSGSAAANTAVAHLAQLDFLKGAAGDQWTAAAANLPENRELVGDVFTFESENTAVSGQAALDIPAAAGDAHTVDMFGWDGQEWAFIPSEIDAAAGQMVTREGTLPQAIAMMKAAAPAPPAVAAEVLPAQELPADVLPLLTEVSAGTLTLVENGELQGEVTAVPAGDYSQYLRVTNTGAIVDQISLSALLSDAATQANQIDALAARAAAANYAGVNLDYQGAAAAQTTAFTQFVENLAAALHAQGLQLVVTLGTPQQASSTWETGGQDWPALGQLADVVYVQLPLDPTGYMVGGKAEQLLAWATRQIDRQKLSILVSANAVDRIGEAFLEMTNSQALTNFGDLQFVQGGETVEPDTAVEVALSGTAGPLEWDGTSLTYKYSYDLSGQTHHVWLANEAALANRLQLAHQFAVRGAAVRGLGGVDNGPGYAAALTGFVNNGELPQPSGAAIVWSVTNGDETVLASSSGEALSFTWEGVSEPGSYAVNAAFALGDSVAELGVLNVSVNEPTAIAEETATSEASAPAESETVTEADATPTPPASFTPGDADAVTNVNANVRLGPGLGYGTVAGGASAGTKVALIGRSSDSSWMNIRLPDGQEGWIFTTLLTINETVNIAALDVVEVDPPVASGDNGGGGGGAPPPVNAPPVTNSGFELGGQAFGAPYGMMSYAGMRWVKKQHKWGPGQGANAVAGVISEAHNAGFKILLSIPGADHSSIDYNAYVSFLGQVAALPDPPDAIEVWNEMNIDREWPAGQISPATYVNNMLAPAYNAIKAASPGTMVISGAPAPTGFFGGCGGGGCDDNQYMAGIAGAGGASYMDCIGIHYNEGIISPNQQSGDPRNPSDHYTRYFWGMVNTYYNAFGGSRPLCFTELGYLTPEGFGGLPGGFAWAGNVTVSQQAQWLAEAASLSSSSGKVRLMIVWNVDSSTWDSDPQAGYAIIRPGGSCPACETLRQVMGG